MDAFWSHPQSRLVAVLLGSVLLAALVEVFLQRVVTRLARRTRSAIDDRVVAALRLPIAISIVLAGSAYATVLAAPSPAVRQTTGDVLASTAVLVWTVAGMRFSSILLDAVAEGGGQRVLIQPQTRPVLGTALKVLVLGVGSYFLLLTWNIDVSGWVASAGIVGIAMGFAAQESLANLVAGISLLADRPFEIGHFLVLDGGTRGRVTQIGLRSTRILTQDDVEIVVPNSKMANSIIVNESGGPCEKERVRLPVGVAYDTDVDGARAILLEVARLPTEVVLDVPGNEPQVQMVGFGESAVDLELLVWIRQPEHLNAVRDQINSAIFRRFGEAGIVFPYPRREVYLRPEPVSPRARRESAPTP